jgi:hypothetical protein
VRAELLQYGADANHPDILFNANLSQASEVHFAAPTGCAGLVGSDTVQKALERLARTANLFYAGGDGQHAVPGQALQQPLAVRLVSDCGPVQGVSVTFTAEGGGRLSTTLPIAVGQGSTSLPVTTDATGVARCFWRLAEGANAPATQKATASLPAQLPESWVRGGSSSVEFSGQLLRASQVTYQPGGQCPALNGVTNVQAALDTLCQREGSRRGVAVDRVSYGSPTAPKELPNDGSLSPFELITGLMIDCEKAPDPVSLGTVEQRKPVCTVTVHMPYLYNGQLVAGTEPVTLSGALGVTGNRITWKPLGGAEGFLRAIAANRPTGAGSRLLATLTLKGRFIWFNGSRREYLGGLTFGRPDTGGQTVLDYDGEGHEEGTDFEMWFWLNMPTPTVLKDIAAPGGKIASGGRTGGAVARDDADAAGGATLRAADDAPGGTVALASLEMPATVRPGEQVQGTVRLSGPAPRGGFEVTLSSGDKGGVKEGVVVPAGKTEAPFRLDLGGAKAGTRVTITATTEAGVLHKRVVIK